MSKKDNPVDVPEGLNEEEEESDEYEDIEVRTFIAPFFNLQTHLNILTTFSPQQISTNSTGGRGGSR